MSKIEFIKTLEATVDMLNLTTAKNQPITIKMNQTYNKSTDRLVVTVSSNSQIFEIYDSDGDVTREDFVDLILKLGK